MHSESLQQENRAEEDCLFWKIVSVTEFIITPSKSQWIHEFDVGKILIVINNGTEEITLCSVHVKMYTHVYDICTSKLVWHAWVYMINSTPYKFMK